MKKDIKIFLAISSLLSIFLLNFDVDKVIIIPQEKESTVITIPQGGFDIGNKQQGTITITMDTNQYTRMIENHNDKEVKYFIFFSSRIMPGFEIRYNLEEQVFEAGIPAFKSQKVDLLNGNGHVLAFTYQLGEHQ